MDSNPYPQINTWLLIVQLIATFLLAIVSIYGLWIAWFADIKIDRMWQELHKVRDDTQMAKETVASLSTRVDVIPTLIANNAPASRTIQ